MQISTRYMSPNWNERPSGVSIDMVILHYTGMKTGEEALQRLCDPDAAVSSHYLIEEDGEIFQLVAEEKRAWHAGVSHWQGRENINHNSIGVELVNPGHEFGYRAFPPAQIDSLLALLVGVKARHKIPTGGFLGHSDIAPGRKVDPGHLFPWRQLAAEGFGVFSDRIASDTAVRLRLDDTGPLVNKVNKQLAIVGYRGCDNVTFGQGTAHVLKAFQAHWRPEEINGVLDEGTAIVLDDIAQMTLQGDTE